MKIRSSLFSLYIPLIYLCLTIESCYSCKKYHNRIVKPVMMDGRVFKKYRDSKNHGNFTIKVKRENGEIKTWPTFHNFAFWKAVNVGDSVYKAPNSLAFHIIRKDTTLTFFPICGCCDTLNNKMKVSSPN